MISSNRFMEECAHGDSEHDRASPEAWLLEILEKGCSQILQTMSDLCGILQRSVAKNSPPPAIIDRSPI